MLISNPFSCLTFQGLTSKNRGTMVRTLKFGMRKQTISDKAFEGRWRNKGISLTVIQYNVLLANQNSCCAICKRHQDSFKHGLSVDHDHISGEVRGLLCLNCNALLGHARDCISVLENAKKYLLRRISLESIEKGY